MQKNNIPDLWTLSRSGIFYAYRELAQQLLRQCFWFLRLFSNRCLIFSDSATQLGFRASDNDATSSGAFRRRILIRRRKAPQVLLSQRRYKPQLQEEGTHPVRCQTRQSSPVRVHLHVCKRRTFVTSFSAYSNIRLQNPLLHVSHFQTQICSLTQVHRRWYYEGYSWDK